MSKVTCVMYKQMNLKPSYCMLLGSNELFYLSGLFVHLLLVWQLTQFPDVVFASASTLN